MSISQSTIASQVGVSRTAVSHVLNGRGHMVSADTRARILKAVEIGGYHRNALVRALRSNRTHVIGVVVPDAGFSFFGKIIRGVETKASMHGFHCFLCQSHSLPEEIEKDVVTLQEYRVDGMVIVPSSSRAKPKIYQSLLQQQFPLVLVDVPVTGLKTHFVGNDNVATGLIATEHLLALGHRRIAFVKGYHENLGSAERLQGYRQALKNAGIPADPALAVGDGFEFEAGREAVCTLLDGKVDFTALITSSDKSALGAIQELARNGIGVPAEVSVVGCGNEEISEMVTPSLTTVDQQSQELGTHAMELLIGQIEGTTEPVRKILVEPKLVVRESSARAPRAAG
jgi:LacI family transcriptional regulator